MKVTRNVITIFDLNDDFKKKKLIINKDYQRNSSLWAPNAASFFIDTILNGFPFPKITIRQTINPNTMSSVREVVDGQQRLTVIQNFINNKIILSNVSQKYKGKKFDDLDEKEKEEFLSYEVSVDTVISGTNKEILEVFRRMNSYSLPLNRQELRHSNHQGEFKWFIFKFVENYSDLLVNSNILTLKQVSRMVDAELFTEIFQIYLNGVQSRSQSKLDGIYKEFDENLPSEFTEKMFSLLKFININFSDVCSHERMSSYQFYSFCAALIHNHNRVSIDKNNVIDTDIDSEGDYCTNIDLAKENIYILFDELDYQEDDYSLKENHYKEFIQASTSTTHSIKHRNIRAVWFLKAIQDSL